MLNFTQLLYKNIANRIKVYMQEHNMSQVTLSACTGIDSSAISKILKSKTSEKKNPYLLSSSQIEEFSNQMKISPYELIWGTREEQEEFIKLIIIALLMNDGEINPFETKPFEEWLRLEILVNSKFEEEKRNTISTEETTSYLNKKYGYFVNNSNSEKYDLIKNQFDYEYEKISNIILKLLLGDYEFSSKFIDHLINYNNNLDSIRACNEKININHYESIRLLIEDFITNKGAYGNIVIDNKSNSYYLFISAFNKFWDRVKDKYIKFFKDNLFSIISCDPNEKNSMKKLKNNDIHKIVKSQSFIQLNEELLLLSEYDNEDFILSNMNLRLQLQCNIQIALFYEKTDDKYFSQCLSNIRNSANLEIEKYRFIKQKTAQVH